MALTVVAEIAGPDFAQTLQLALEYAPEPPFATGRPEIARARDRGRGARQARIAGCEPGKPPRRARENTDNVAPRFARAPRV